MRTVETLICEAIEHAGGPAALARALDVHRSEITEMAKGRRKVSPAVVGLLCDTLKLDGAEAQRLAAEAVIAAAKDSVRERLRKAFFALLAVGVGLSVATTKTDANTTDGQTKKTAAIDNLYIVTHWLRRLGTLVPVFHRMEHYPLLRSRAFGA